MDSETPPSRVSEIRQARGLTQAELSRRAQMQVPTVNKIELGMRNVTANTAPALSRALHVPVQELYAPVGSPIPPPPPPMRDRAPGGLAPPEVRLPAFATLDLDLPVHGSAEGGPDGVFELFDASHLAVDVVRRPPGLQGIRDAFALYTAGDSMSPWREPGDLIFIQPGRQPRPGAYVVVVFHPGSEGEPRRAMVKRLIRRTGSKIVVEQFNPAKQIELDAADVQDLWRVIDWQEALGFT